MDMGTQVQGIRYAVRSCHYSHAFIFLYFANLGPPKHVEHEQFREELKKVDNYVSYYLSYQISNFEKIKELFLGMFCCVLRLSYIVSTYKHLHRRRSFWVNQAKITKMAKVRNQSNRNPHQSN